MKRNFSENGYYHIYNRGALKQTLFHSQTDYIRFLFCMFAFSGRVKFPLIKRMLGQHSFSDLLRAIYLFYGQILKEKQVSIISFCIMPNHFHIVVHELEKGGVSKYMHRLLGSYALYFNLKYKKSGHVFQSSYQVKEIVTDTYMGTVIRYVHNNPKKLKPWKKRYREYPWSSLQDYLHHNRWGKLLE